MPIVTLSKAAQLTGKSKSIISKAIHEKKLAATRDNKSWFQIDTEALFALYPPKQNRTKKELLSDIEAYKQQIVLLTQQLADERAERHLIESSQISLSEPLEGDVIITHLQSHLQPTEIDKHISQFLKCLDNTALSMDLLWVYWRLVRHYIEEWKQFESPMFQRFNKPSPTKNKFVYQIKNDDIHKHILYGTALSVNPF